MDGGAAGSYGTFTASGADRVGRWVYGADADAREMDSGDVCGIKDYTLQAHRGSFKSSCLATGCALLVGERGRNTGWPMGTAR